MHVIVIGAGVIGTAIAFRLSQGGHRVTVIDPNPGSGASYAAAGMLTPVGEAWHGETELLHILTDSWRRYPEFVRTVEAASQRPSGYRPTPTLICASHSGELDGLHELHRVTQAAGLRSESLTTREARRLEPALSPRLAGAYLAADDHHVDPRMLCAALRAAVEAGGANLVRKSVESVENQENSLTNSASVRLADGTRREADVIVVANGLGAAELLPEVDVMRPIHGDILRLAPARLGPPLLTNVIRGIVNQRPVYLVPRADGSIVLGATAREDDDPRPNVGGMHNLLRDAVALTPGIVDLAVQEFIARARPGTPDNLPLVGEISPGVIAATGFYRHGVLLTPWAADAVTALVEGNADAVPGLAACDPARFATVRS